MEHFILTAAGVDKKGLVARVAETLYLLGCNLEDSAMTRLQGEFAMLVIFSAPPAVKFRALERRLTALKRGGLTVHVKPMSGREAREPRHGAPGVLVAIHGADRPGIVFRATKLLARARVNVTDLTTHRTSARGAASGYILYLEGEKPPALTDRVLEEKLRAGLSDLGVTVSVKPLNAATF